MPYKIGDQLRQKVFVAAGSVADVRYDAVKGDFQYLVAFTGEDGEPTERWFDESAVEINEGGPE